jgi:hypothetical protein
VDAERRYLGCQRLDPAFEAELRGRVCGAELLADDAAGRGDRDDQTGAVLTHPRQYSSSDVQGAEKVRLDLRPEVVRADLFEEPGDEVARVVDQDVDPAELVDRSPNGGLGIIGTGHVELDDQQLVLGSDGGGDLLRVAARGHYYGVTGSQCGLGDVRSRAASSTCDQPNFLTHRFSPA